MTAAVAPFAKIGRACSQDVGPKVMSADEAEKATVDSMARTAKPSLPKDMTAPCLRALAANERV